jgi:hypothetical protein
MNGTDKFCLKIQPYGLFSQNQIAFILPVNFADVKKYLNNCYPRYN